MKMAFEYDCGNEDTPQNSENLMNIVREYPANRAQSLFLASGALVLPSVYF